MKRLFLLLFLLISSISLAQTIPAPQGWVNDFAGVISAEYKQKLSSLISELEQKTGAEIAVVTLESIAPYTEAQYAQKIFDNWKIGKKGKDNGVLILLAVKERRWRIQTGYGVEGILPDAVCSQIGQNNMVPYFKRGQYSQGLYSGVVDVANIISKDAHVTLNQLPKVFPKQPHKSYNKKYVPMGFWEFFLWGLFFLAIFIGILCIPILSALFILIVEILFDRFPAAFSFWVLVFILASGIVKYVCWLIFPRRGSFWDYDFSRAGYEGLGVGKGGFSTGSSGGFGGGGFGGGGSGGGGAGGGF